MKRHDLLELAGRNLREALLRNSLTTLGIGVGVASLVAMLSLGIGLQELANRRLANSGLFETIIVYSRRDITRLPRAERRASREADEARALDDAARQEMERLPHVAEVYPEVRFPTEFRFNDRTYFTMVSGLPFSTGKTDVFSDITGQFFSSPDAAEAIVQEQFARDLTSEPKSLVGKELLLRYAERRPLADGAARSSTGDGEEESGNGFTVVRREKALRIVGVTDADPEGFRGGSRGRVFIPLDVAQELNAIQSSSFRELVGVASQGRTYQTLIVRMDAPTRVKDAQDAIKKMGFATFSLLDATRSLTRFFVILDLFLGIFGSLALAVASLGIVNTLVMAILERRREIGIMKALGASERDIKRLFFAEAGAMGLAGGVLGVTMGWAIGRVINFGTNVYLQSQELPPEQIWWVPWWLVAGAIAFGIAVSLLAGSYPAARAARLDPIQALRYE